MSKLSDLKKLIFFYLIIVSVKVMVSTKILYPLYLSDERQYFEMAYSFIKTGKFLFEGEPSAQYPPLYPITISLATLFDKLMAVKLAKVINAFVSTGIIFPAWLISREFLRRREAVLISSLCALIPDTFAYTFTLMSENLFYPLFLFSIFLIGKAFNEDNLKVAVIAGVFVGLTILTRMIGVILVLSIPLLLFVKRLRSFKIGAMVLVVSLLTIFPWLLRNAHYFGYSLSGILGYRNFGKVNLAKPLRPVEIIYYATVNLTYIAFSSMILPMIGIFMSLAKYNKIRNKKFRNFFMLTLILLLLLLWICTYWTFTDLSGRLIGIPNKIMGRYLSTITPVVLILGFVAISNIKVKMDEMLVYLFALSFLLLIFPINEMTAGFDTLSTVILYAPLMILNNPYIHIFERLILISFPFVVYLIGKKLGTFSVLLMFLIFQSIAATSAIYLGSMDASEYMEFALWVKDNIPRKSIILVDKDPKEKEKLGWVVEALKFWTDNEVIISRFDKLKSVDYVVSERELDLKLIKKVEAIEGIHHLRKETFYLFKV